MSNLGERIVKLLPLVLLMSIGITPGCVFVGYTALRNIYLERENELIESQNKELRDANAKAQPNK